MARPPKDTKPVASTAQASELFSEEELKALEASAQAEFEAEQKEEAAAAFKEETKRRLKQKAMFQNGKDAVGEAVEMLVIDLAPHAPYIVLDGRYFYHGVSYKFTQGQAQTVKEAMFRSWQHEREIGGANLNAEAGYRPVSRSISPFSGAL